MDRAALEVAYMGSEITQENELEASTDILLAEMDTAVIHKQGAAAVAVPALIPKACEENATVLKKGTGVIASSVSEESNNGRTDITVQVSDTGSGTAVAARAFHFQHEGGMSNAETAQATKVNFSSEKDLEEYSPMLDRMVAAPTLSQQAAHFNVLGSCPQRQVQRPACLEATNSWHRWFEAEVPVSALDFQSAMSPELDLSWMDATNAQQSLESGWHLSSNRVLSAVDYDSFAPEPDQGPQNVPSAEHLGMSAAEDDIFFAGPNARYVKAPCAPHKSGYGSTIELPAPQTISKARRVGDKGPGVIPIITETPDSAYNPKRLAMPTKALTDIDLRNPDYERNTLYKPLEVPQPWDYFRYNIFGELDPMRRYTPAEINRYLFAHPLNHGQTPQTSLLNIWIQRNPSYSRGRYPSTYSHRCRFTTCPNSTINQGNFCVAFDEQTSSIPDHDPFISAGYVHLWCLERFCDLPKIFAELNVSPDTRSFPLERKGCNPMRLSSTTEERTVILFKESCRSGSLSPSYPRYNQENRPHEGTLTHTLAVIKLQEEPSSTTRYRHYRARKAGYQGSTLTAHLGNLEVETTLRRKTRLHENQNQLKEAPRTGRRYFKGVSDEGASANDEESGKDMGKQDFDGRPKMKPRSARYIPPFATMAGGPNTRSTKRDLGAFGPTSPSYEPVAKRRMTAAKCSKVVSSTS
ncbi:MAG: hypothetical protein Q9163_001177 [Psora crenata]